MKKIILLVLALGLFFSACVTHPPTESVEQPRADSQSPSADLPITMETVGRLTPLISLQPSAGALVCKWAREGTNLWVQDLFSASLYDAATMDKLAEFKGGEYATIYDTSEDGHTVAYSLDGQEIKLFDILAQNDRLSFSPSFPYSSVFFSPDGSILSVASLEEIEIVQFDTSDGMEAGSLSGFTTAAPVYSAHYSADGKMLIWISRGRVQPMDITSGKLGPSLAHEDFVVSAVMSADGNLIATASAGTLNGEFQPLVILWDAQSGEVLWQNGNRDYFSSLDFSPDGSLLAAGSVGETIFYETASGKEIFRLKTDNASVNSLGFSPDGRALVTCVTDGKLTLWKAR